MSSREMIRKIKQDGWFLYETRGDHYQFKHPTKPGKVTVPHPIKDLPKFVIKSIREQAQLK